ncbi:MAG TPA: hypothetical protein VGE66_09780 [Chitinophagaceae bacterium]
MIHLSIAWFALLMGIGAWILVGDYVKFLKFEHELKARKEAPPSRKRKEVSRDIPVPA